MNRKQHQNVIMKLAPNIIRQRLLIEGFYSINIDKEIITHFFREITNKLELKVYGEPIIYSPEGLGKGENQGYDAFIPLIDSGISLYVWSESKFLSLIIYSCKHFNSEEAINNSISYFQLKEFESKLF